MSRQYTEDSLMMKDSTTVDELTDFVRRRTRNPFIMNGKLIWNYSSYKVDSEALQSAVQTRLDGERYVIPFQVTGVWGYMTHLIPDQISKGGKVLVYLEDKEKYIEYENLVNNIEEDEIEELKMNLQNDISAFKSQ